MPDAEAIVNVDTNGTVDVEIQGTNKGNDIEQFVLGLSFETPSGIIVNAEPKRTEKLLPGDTFSVKFSNLTEGCVNPRDGEPVKQKMFSEKGTYNLITRVYTKTLNDSDKCFGVSLENPVTDQIVVNNAVKVSDQDGIKFSDAAKAGAVLAGVGILAGIST